MRDVVFSLPAPQPSSGWGFRFSKRIAFAMLIVGGLVAGAVAPVQAADVSVHLKLSAGRYEGQTTRCTVSVPAGANGLAVLDKAVASNCIESYEATTYSFGVFVDCINQICGAPWRAVTGPTDADGFSLLYWEMFENGTCTSYGVSDFKADPGDELAFVYTTWLTGFAPGLC